MNIDGDLSEMGFKIQLSYVELTTVSGTCPLRTSRYMVGSAGIMLSSLNING